jgi:hypothetical protein
MPKKIIILILVFAAVVFAVLFFALKRSSPSGISNPVPSAQSSGTVSAGLATPSVIDFSNVPTGDSFVLGTPSGSVAVKNFFRLPMVRSQEFLILENTNDYQITYDTVNGQFFIYASSSPLSAARAAGEAAFLTMLGISQSDACKLDVAEGYPMGMSSASLEIGLSFCAPGAFGQ